MLLLYILWDDWTIFMISGSNEQLQQELEYTLLKPDCHSWRISKMQSDTLEERYAIKFCFKLGKMPEKRMECWRRLLRRGLEFHVFTINKMPIEKSLETYRMQLVCALLSAQQTYSFQLKNNSRIKSAFSFIVCWFFSRVNCIKHL